MTYMLLLNICALKLVEEIILYYDARSKKHETTNGFAHRALEQAFWTQPSHLHVKGVGFERDLVVNCRGRG